MGPAGPRVVVSTLRGDEYKVSVTGFSLPSQSLIAGCSPSTLSASSRRPVFTDDCLKCTRVPRFFAWGQNDSAGRDGKHVTQAPFSERSWAKP